MADKKLYVVKSDKGHYWCGYNTWSTQIRHSKVYVIKKYAQETVDRWKEWKPIIVGVELKEVDNGKNI